MPARPLEELMAAAQGGDGEAYVELLEEITPWLRAIVRKRRQFLGRDVIEDLVQDVLLSLHSVRTTYDARRPFKPWLLAIVRNRIADGARRYARGAAHEVPVEDFDVTISELQTNTKLEDYGDAEALRRAVEELPRGQRDAIELLKLQELSLKEASARSGTSAGALKVATFRAMSALRRKLTKP